MTRCALNDDFNFALPRMIARKTRLPVDVTGWGLSATVSNRQTGAVLATWTSANGRFNVLDGPDGRLAFNVPKQAMQAPLTAGEHLVVCRRVDGGRSDVFLRRLIIIAKADP